MRYGLVCSSLLLLSSLATEVRAEGREEVTEVLDTLSSLEDENARLKRPIKAQNEDLKAKIRYIEELTSKIDASRNSHSQSGQIMRLPTSANTQHLSANSSSLLKPREVSETLSVDKSQKEEELVKTTTTIKATATDSLRVSSLNSKSSQSNDSRTASLKRLTKNTVGSNTKGDTSEAKDTKSVAQRRMELALRAKAQLAEIQRLEKLRLLREQNQYLDTLSRESRRIDALIAKRDKLYKGQKRGYVTVGVTPLETASGVSYEDIREAFKVGGLDADRYAAYRGAMRHFTNLLEEDIRVLSIFNK